MQVWRVHLRRTCDELRSLSGWLSADERDRAASYRFDVHRDRYIAGRGALRQVLVTYLNCDPKEVEFRYGRYGKPELAAYPVGMPIEFNLSHAQDEALIAVTLGHRVGVDLEQIRPLDDLAGMAPSVFSRVECEVLAGLESGQQMPAFFLAWTRKEALLKALGTGFSVSSREFEVSLAPDEPARLNSVPVGSPPPADWSLLDVAVAGGFAGALAVDSPAVQVEIRDFVW